MNKKQIFFLVLGGILLRLAPHIPNVAPVGAIALFAGYQSKSKWAWVLPLLVMIPSDFVLGFHKTIPYVYGSYVLISLLGYAMRSKVNTHSVLGFSLISSIVFYIITNFGVWATGTMYTKDLAGLMQCYTYAIPFYRATIAGDLVYNFLLFFLFAYRPAKKASLA